MGETVLVVGAVLAGLDVFSRGVGVDVEGAGATGAKGDVELLPTKELEKVREWRPCTSRSALQAYSNKVVISAYSL